METEKRDRIRKIADERFSWAEMAKRSLGRNWAKFSAAQQQEFVPLFTNLIYGAYMDKVADYKGEQIVYKGEKVEGRLRDCERYHHHGKEYPDTRRVQVDERQRISGSSTTSPSRA